MGELEGMEMVVEDDEEKSKDELKWESILPRMVLRVLLVEADDSTRQIISSLLRKFNYKVAAISDGLKAWEILKCRHSNIDLILTELDLPSISGYALLTLIMEHDGCKDIPVIIMSSQDSISMVLKCLLKGAADFLVKPVRKNELKNLWRHVWRRLANNAGHNPQDITAGQHKTEAIIENIPSTDHSGDYVSPSRKSSGFSEKATDALVKSRDHTVVNLREGQHQAKNVKGEDLSLNTNVIDGMFKSYTSIGEKWLTDDVLDGALVDVEGSCTGIASNYGRDGPGNHTYRAVIVPERQVLNHSSGSPFSWYSRTKKPWTSFPSSEGKRPKIKVVSDSPHLSKPSTSNWENKPNILVPESVHCDPVSPHHQMGPVPLPGLAMDNGVWASYGAVFQPIFGLYSGLTARNPNSALQREESPLQTSHSLHSDPGTHSSVQGGSQAGNELKTRESVERPGCSSSQVVDPSGSSTQCKDFGSEHKLSAQGSASEITEVNASGSGIMGLSFVEESDGCKPYIHDHFKSKMGIHSAEREAALAKFRHKRKGRCFEKKVRDQSR